MYLLNIKQSIYYIAIKCPPMESSLHVERTGRMRCCTWTDEPCCMYIALPCHTVVVCLSLLRPQGYNPTVHCHTTVQWRRISPLCYKRKGFTGEEQNRVRAVKSWRSYLIFSFLQSFCQYLISFAVLRVRESSQASGFF